MRSCCYTWNKSEGQCQLFFSAFLVGYPANAVCVGQPHSAFTKSMPCQLLFSYQQQHTPRLFQAFCSVMLRASESFPRTWIRL